MFRSDLIRATGVLGVALAAGIALAAYAPALREAGILPPAGARADIERPELVYTIINVTESLSARQACPLDLDLARPRIETRLAGSGVIPVFSPIAEGPDVLTHEVMADTARSSSTMQTCQWTALALLEGQRTALHRDQGGAALSSLDAVAHDVAAWLDAAPATPPHTGARR